MTGKVKRRSLRCGERPKADFGSIFTSYIAPVLGVAGAVADSAVDSHRKNDIASNTNSNTGNGKAQPNIPKVDTVGLNKLNVPNPIPSTPSGFSQVKLPTDSTKAPVPANRLGGRHKCWIGAAIGAATSIGSSIFGNSAKKKQERLISSQRDWQDSIQEVNAMTTALNNSSDYQEDYLRQFRTAARLGKTLGANKIYITDGGDAVKVDNNTYLLQGGSHEDINETGQTGIGINVGGNQVEAEGGEVAQKKGNSLRIFSAQPILGGISPAQAVLRGYNKDFVFSQQQAFKKRNGLKDDGNKLRNGGIKGPTYNKQTRRWYNAQGKMLRIGHGYYSQNSNKFVQYNTDGTISKFSTLDWMFKELRGEKHTQSMRVGNKSIGLKPAFTIGKGAMYSPIRIHNVQLKNNKNRDYTIDSEDIINDVMNVIGGGGKLFGKKFKVQNLNTKFAIPYGKGITINGREVSKNLLDSIAYNAGLNKYPIDKLNYAYGLPSQESHNGRIASGNIVNKSKLYNTKEYNNAIANMNVFKNFGVIPANVVVRNWSNKNDAGTNKRTSYDLSTNLSPLYQSFDLFRRGLYNTGDKNHTNDVRNAGNLIINSPEFKTYWNTSGKRQYTRGYNDTNKSNSYNRMINSNKEYSRYINHYPNKRLFKLGGRCKLRYGGLTSKDRGSSKHPYPSVSSKDFAGGGRSYPIPTKADAVDALRLAGLHGRSDVRIKVYSKYPSLRPKARTGIYVPFNKRYTPIDEAPDYNDIEINGGNALGTNEVVATAKRIKPTYLTPNNDARKLLESPEIPYHGLSSNKSRTIFSGGDYLGLGIDTLAALSTGLINYNSAGNYYLPDRAPIISASKLPTNYNVAPQIEEIKRYRDNLTRDTYNNTSSSVAALNRAGSINLNALSELSKLWATKENEENKMLTEDAKNQQAVAVQNAQNEMARSSEIARIKNEAEQSKANALNVGLSGLSQAWTNFWTAGRTAYEDDQSRRAAIASSKEATPTRLIEMGYDLSPDIINALYQNATDNRTRRFYLSKLSPKSRLRYGIN
uniref:Uncharacterized protein n=1 Tax=Geladintestivirus 3 TaxID=3233135 RepID=A0AAU8MKA4_9CAUD